jgi:ubiquinone/menaquinone biosynthesis C-methylase UbiE
MVLHHAPDPAAAIAEMARIVKPGGRLVITDCDRHDHEWMRTEMADVWLGFDRADVRRWFEAAGLDQVAVNNTGQNCCATCAAGDDRAAISVFVAGGSRPAARSGAETEEDVRDAVREHYAALARAASGPTLQTSGPANTTPENLIELLPAAGSCCTSASSCCAPGSLDFGDLPAGAQTGAPPSWGCGNPTALAELKPGQVVLDLGSGAGFDAFLAAKQVAPGGRVIGVDMTSEMLELARSHAARLGLADMVEFRQGHIEALPVEDRSVDVILSNCVVNLSPDKDTVFREAYRVLRPGGWLSISDIVTDGPLPDVIRKDVELWAGCVGGAVDEAEYLGKVRAAGFDQVEIGSRVIFDPAPGVRIASLTFRAFKPEGTG